jgi:serine/threonine protein kinase
LYGKGLSSSSRIVPSSNRLATLITMPLRVIASAQSGESDHGILRPKQPKRRQQKDRSTAPAQQQQQLLCDICRCTVCANSPLRGHSCHGVGAMHSEDRFFGSSNDGAVAARAEPQHPLQGGRHSLLLHDVNDDDFDPLDVSVLDLMSLNPAQPFKPQTMQEREDRTRDLPRIDHRRACQLAETAQHQLDKLREEWAGVNDSSTSSSSSSRVVAPLDKSEVVIGARLGSGGFSAVYEVHSLRLDSKVDGTLDDSQRAARSFLRRHADAAVDACSSHETGPVSSSRMGRRNSDDSLLGMLNLGLQRTTARYAVKHMRFSLAENVPKFEKAAVDITLEAQLLQVLDHPNIVSIRGISRHGTASFRGGCPSDYFVVIDCLPEQLDDRFFAWRQQFRKYQAKVESTKRSAALSSLLQRLGGRQKRMNKFQAKLHSLMLERLQVAHEVASGIEYLHDRRVMHRDIKTCNIGFDSDGVAQIFDLGLARILPPEQECLHDGYVMSRVGTKSNMAPEVSEKRPYDLKADVYSFGIVLWEILSLSSATEYFRMLKRKESAKRNGSLAFSVNPAAAAPTADASSAALSREGSTSSFFVNKDECVLPICKCWSEPMQELVARCLSSQAELRPTIAQVRQALFEELQNGGYEFSSPSHPRRRRSTFRLEAGAAGSPARDHATTVAAAKVVANMMRNKLGDDEDDESSTAFASYTVTTSS